MLVKWLERLGMTAVYGFLFLPMVVLVALSFNAAPRGIAWQGFTFDWYLKLFADQAILSSLWISLGIALVATLLSAVFGLCLGVAICRGSPFSRAGLKKISNVPILLPEIIQGLSLLCFFVWMGLPLGRISVIIAHCSFGVAYIAGQVRARLQTLDPLIEDAAGDLGATPYQIFLTVTLPQLYSALASGMLMVFTLSFDDFIITFFTAGAGATTLPIKIYSMLKFGVGPEVNALSSLILVTSFILVGIAFWIQSLGREKAL